jgi:integrase/recombinase XerD
VLRDDPTAQIAMPKIGRSLPKSLTEEEVESLLSAPAISDPLGIATARCSRCSTPRACASRNWSASSTTQVNLNQGVLRVLGKGNRERLIPLGEEAVRWLQEFIAGVRATRSCSTARPTTCSRRAAAIA